MRIIVTVLDESGAAVATEQVDGMSGLTVIMVKSGADGKPRIESFEPLEVDKHPDTLRQLGGRIADFDKE